MHDRSSVEAPYEYACACHQRGLMQQAQDAYLAVLTQAPQHRGALLNLGTLLYETQYRTAARTVYEELIRLYPQDPDGRVNLGNLLREQGDLQAARLHYEAAIAVNPDHAPAHQGLAYVWEELGDKEKASHHRHLGFSEQPIVTLRSVGQAVAIPLVLLFSAVGGNTPLWSLLDRQRYLIHVVFVDYVRPEITLPPHALIVCAVSDADLVPEALQAAEEVAARSAAPVVNAPAALLQTGRVAMMDRLRGIPDVVAPKTVRCTRAQLLSPTGLHLLDQMGFTFPLLLRTPGCHTGHHFARVNTVDGLKAVVSSLPGEELLVIAYIDCTRSDHTVRKYRVMMIDGVLYPWHLAIASDWKVHYYTAQMAQHAAYREEEARFLTDMEGVLGSRVITALQEIERQIGLDYAGIDFALREGQLVLFEVNATMVVHPPEPGALFAYRQPAFAAIAQATARLFARKLAATSHDGS